MAHQPLREGHRPQPTLTRARLSTARGLPRMATHHRDPPGDRSRPDTFTLASGVDLTALVSTDVPSDDRRRATELLREADWSGFWQEFPVAVPAERRAQVERENDPLALAAVIPRSFRVMVYVGDGEPFAQATADIAGLLGLRSAVLPTGTTSRRLKQPRRCVQPSSRSSTTGTGLAQNYLPGMTAEWATVRFWSHPQGGVSVTNVASMMRPPRRKGEDMPVEKLFPDGLPIAVEGCRRSWLQPGAGPSTSPDRSPWTRTASLSGTQSKSRPCRCSETSKPPLPRLE